jgi:hypothetical protein
MPDHLCAEASHYPIRISGVDVTLLARADEVIE